MATRIAKLAVMYDVIRRRFISLSWEVHFDYLEVISIWALWNLGTTFVSLESHDIAISPAFTMLMRALPQYSWATICFSLFALELFGLFTLNSLIRRRTMFSIFLLFIAVTVFIAGAVHVGLAWKDYAIFTCSAGWSYVRLRKEMVRSVVRKRKCALNAGIQGCM